MKLLAKILFVLACSATAHPGKRLQLEQLVEDSDLIAVVDISSIQDVGAIEAEADAVLLRDIKGPCPERLTLGFYTPPRVRGLSRDSDRSANGLS
jgi:hypothetical protein